ncbi:MAG: nucleotide pyrophosphohydrolase [Candidatus Moraniibacteriota bacterium]
MSEIKKLTEKILKFRRDRDWEQFHTPKDLAISLSLEAGEVLEHFQWKSKEEIEKHITTNKEEIGDELGDVFNYLLLMAHDFKIDLAKAAENKIKKSALKYPIEKARGRHTKYNKL